MAAKSDEISRRQAVTRAGVLVGATLISGCQTTVQPESRPALANASAGFLFCLNSATIRGQKLGIVKEIEVAAQAGYQAIEPWVDSIAAYQKQGGSLPDLKRRIADLGLTVESAIAFPQWIVDDEAKRAKGLEQAKVEMDLVAQIGAKRLAAPPAGATDLPRLDLLKAAERYRALLEAGDQLGVVPQLELWGFSKNLNRLGECACVAIETGHPKACVLVDVYHLYKGGSDFHGLGLLGKNAVQVLHMNDYPADPPRERIDDSYRVYPGDGVAPVTEILRLLHSAGGQTVLSLELFNRKLWAMDALEVARAGLDKMKLAVNKALGR
ncbi:MAG: sugar phosphate isomerase/epimerase [Verrucomicrobia bacterium]|nr:sugar phosphate isomerase/epimerase [Verrucomicrobiota bacterium]